MDIHDTFLQIIFRNQSKKVFQCFIGRTIHLDMTMWFSNKDCRNVLLSNFF